MTLHAVPSPEDSSWPESKGAGVCFLVDASGPVEKRLIAEWIARHRPVGEGFDRISLPPSRRRRGRARLEKLQAHLDAAEDPMLVPLRVVWSPPRRRGRRVPRFIDLITLGDPRDPNRLLQELIVRIRPERVRVLAGRAARLSDLRKEWVEERAHRPDAPTGFAEFVALRGALTLEVEERRLRGNRYKVPRFLSEDLRSSAAFRAGIAGLARDSGEDEVELERRTARYLSEIAATPSTFVIDLVASLIRIVYTMGYDRRIQYDRKDLDRIAELGQRHALAFLPSHKSNMDHLALSYVLYENGLPPNHTAGGINMNFFPIGHFLRRHGIFFIRRSFKDNEPYKFVLKRYIDYLLSKRFPLEWYIEGGRSRSGKLRPPRLGLLAYVVDSWKRGSCDDVVLVPTSIAYDQIQDVSAYAAEQRGKAKEKESFSWMVKVLRALKRRYGRIYVRFGDPIFLSQTLQAPDEGATGPAEPDLEIAKLAFEVAVRINRATPITPISLVTLALLGNGDRALTVDETLEALGAYLEFVSARSLPVTERLELDDRDEVAAALDALADHGVVARIEGGTETVYAVGPDQSLSAAYYRNTIIHFFTTQAIAELALVAASGADDPGAVFWDVAMAIRDALKFEFFFPERNEFRAEVSAELDYHCPDWERVLADDGAGEVLATIRPFTAHWVLRPVLEAYLLVGDALVASDFRMDLEAKALTKRCLALGEQYRAQRRIASGEAISTVLFNNAVHLAENRGLLAGGEVERLREREQFAAELAELVERVRVVGELAGGRDLPDREE
jgi:glycerol-3-phosphate O-acyltransferase